MIRSRRDNDRRPGQLMALALAGSWRHEIAALAFTEGDLMAIAPGLLASAGAPLCWRRIRSTPLAATDSGLNLREAYLSHRIQETLGERALTRLVRALQAAGVDPLLAKGWATARYYPEPGMRPYGDIDLFVGAERYATAKDLL